MIRLNQKIKITTTLAFLLFCFAGKAQQFNWEADLDQVPCNGFYNIRLSPDIISKTRRADLADIKIYDKINETPYLLRTTNNYFTIPAPGIKNTIDAIHKNSIVQIDFNQEYLVEKLSINIDGPEFYRRDAYVAELNAHFKNRIDELRYSSVTDFIISSAIKTSIPIDPNKKHNRLYIIIENEDNVPLKIKSINSYQHTRYLTAYLEKGKKYTLKIGNPVILPPKYDLSYFKDSISSIVPYINIKNFRKKAKITTTNAIFTNKSWIWLAIIMLIALIAYISFQMINDMKKSKNSKIS